MTRAVAVLALACMGCAATPPGAAGQVFDDHAAEELRATLPPLGEELSARTRALAEAYRRHYPPVIDASWSIGTIDAGQYRVALQLFVAADTPRGVAVLLHGYLDHVALNRSAVSALLEQGFAVVAFDMPGHGLSDGARGEIDAFRSYATVLDRAVTTGRRELSKMIEHNPGGPHNPADPHNPAEVDGLSLVGVGHSTGAAVFLEYLERFPESEHTYDALVFAAPLVRTWLWPLSRLGIRIASPFLENVGRRIDAASSNPEYVELAKERDPLGVYRVPLSWAEAYLRWEEDTPHYGRYDVPLLLLQAQDDTVVDNAYNRRFLRERFELLRELEIENARHALFNEPPELRGTAFDAVAEFLDSFAAGGEP